MAEQKQLYEQIEFFEILSPCKGVCQVNNRGYCLGCFRSRDERFQWNQLSDVQKKHIIKLCSQREKRVRQQLAEDKHKQAGSDEQTQLDI